MTQEVYMIEISFQDPRHGQKQFCAKASDKLASIEQCTIIHVKPKDPCISSPCKNRGECIAKKDGTAQCFCKHGATGERCQNSPDPCYDKDFCKNGGTCDYGYCICPPEVTGMNCENVFSSCDQNVCPGHGMCIDTPGGKQDHECLCTNLFTGQQCATNPFPFIDCIITPNDPKCVSCNMSHNPCNTGECKIRNGSHTCICPEGFVGKDCQTAIDVTRANLNSKFISPTLAPGSVITCDPLSGVTGTGVTDNCEFPVHVFWNGAHHSSKPVIEGTSISKDMKIDRHSVMLLKNLNTTNTAGFDKTLTAIVQLINPDSKMFQIGMHVVCLFVKQGTVQTDYRCFRINVEFDVLKLRKRLTKSDGRLFESPTLPGGSEIVCVKDKFCHINLYTAYKSSPNCLPPVFQSDAPCTVFGPKETEFYMSGVGTVCHSDIAYSTGGLAVGTTKDICFQATQDGESRCFLLHIIAESKDFVTRSMFIQSMSE
ncbi:uncharacterized protein LOC134710869 [Mytilus trossulus]|uniref:uncharacterized protein LOC134710869 n=1 Tax=Mytilus trossulus TaxID=6551 RepID=UPI003004E5A0